MKWLVTGQKSYRCRNLLFWSISNKRYDVSMKCQLCEKLTSDDFFRSILICVINGNIFLTKGKHEKLRKLIWPCKKSRWQCWLSERVFFGWYSFCVLYQIWITWESSRICGLSYLLYHLYHNTYPVKGIFQIHIY